jgi:hypothetical protein
LDCQCFGELHYGYYDDPYNNGTAVETLEQMRNFKTYSKNTQGWVVCEDALFGADTNVTMQCFCEREKQQVPTLCAEDGSDCMCNGAVFYM